MEEGRLNNGMFFKMRICDIIVFESSQTGEKIRVQIIRKTPYDSFSSMLETEGLRRVLPHETSIDTGMQNIYYKYYMPAQEKEFGVVAIVLKVVGANKPSNKKHQKKKKNPDHLKNQYGGSMVLYYLNKHKYNLIKNQNHDKLFYFSYPNRIFI